MADQPQGNVGTFRFDIPRFGAMTDVRMKDEPSIGANYWTLSAFTSHNKDGEWLGLRLQCNSGFYSNLWACEATVRFSLLNKVPEETHTIDIAKRFSHTEPEIKVNRFKKFSHIIREHGFCQGGKVSILVTVWVHQNIGSAMIIRETFSEPKEHLTDVALIVEGKKMYVGKQSMAMHSKYFHSMFFSKLEDQGKQEFELEGVNYEEMVDLLNMIYPSTQVFNEKNLSHILKLAVRFEVWFVVQRCEVYLRSNSMPEIDKLIIAEQFNLALVQYDALTDLNTLDKIAALAVHPRYEEIGPLTMKLLFKKFTRMMHPKLFPNDDEYGPLWEAPAPAPAPAPLIPQQQE